MIRSVHPFPARMAPDLAIAELKELEAPSTVLDPMVGSGTVVRQASALGHRGIGFDMDPLAVLMTQVWTTPVNDRVIVRLAREVVAVARDAPASISLPWIDGDEETGEFIDYWFAESQRLELRRLAYSLSSLARRALCAEELAAAALLRLALSRIIITKDQGASLARDISHSRPHKVTEISAFEVMPAFDRSVRQVRQLLAGSPPVGRVEVALGDARSIKGIKNEAVDAVMTSPPYLNAIDYMRGHRLSLVWLGYRLSELRQIRSNSIGAERSSDQPGEVHLFKEIKDAMGRMDDLPRRYVSMVERYAEDIYRLMSEVARVLKSRGRAILVVGNSCLKGTFIRNSDGVVSAASMVGLRLLRQVERELPSQNRYLPIPAGVDEPLGKRMRTETILTFVSL